MNPNSCHIVVKANVNPDLYTDFATECRIEGESHSAMLRRLMRTYTQQQKDKRDAAKRERANIGPHWALKLPGRANYAMTMRSHQ